MLQYQSAPARAAARLFAPSAGARLCWTEPAACANSNDSGRGAPFRDRLREATLFEK